MIVSWVTYVWIIDAFTHAVLMKIVHRPKAVWTTLVRTHVTYLHVVQTPYARYLITEHNALAWMVWYRVQQPRLDVFDRQPHHAAAIEIVKMDWHVFKVNVRHVVQPIENVTVTNDAKAEYANHFVVAMTTVVMAKYAKTSFVLPDVDQTPIVLEI